MLLTIFRNFLLICHAFACIESIYDLEVGSTMSNYSWRSTSDLFNCSCAWLPHGTVGLSQDTHCRCQPGWRPEVADMLRRTGSMNPLSQSEMLVWMSVFSDKVCFTRGSVGPVEWRQGPVQAWRRDCIPSMVISTRFAWIPAIIEPTAVISAYLMSSLACQCFWRCAEPTLLTAAKQQLYINNLYNRISLHRLA